MENEIAEYYTDKMADTIQQALKWKFPDMKDVAILKRETSKYTISFENDGIHTEEIVNKFLAELMNNALNLEVDKVTKL